MNITPALVIVTADDFPVFTAVSKACDLLVQDAGMGEHRYGGKHYHGHHVVFKKWELAKTLKAQQALNALHR